MLAAASYVGEQSGNPEVGDRVLEALTEVMQKLAEFPTMGRARFEIRQRLRSFASPPFVVFYRRKRNGVHILRVLHERQDLETAFPKRKFR